MNIHLSRIVSFCKFRKMPIDVKKRFITTTNYCNFPINNPKSQISSKRSHDDINNEPLPYFGSQAASWQAQRNRSGEREDGLWYQPYVVSGSLAIFLIYFCILREENDIDIKLGKSLYEHVDNLEVTQLCISYKYNKENGLDVKDLEKRLHELGIDITKIVE